MLANPVMESVPIIEDRDGVQRVGGTRVTLDTIVSQFKRGAVPEEIVMAYPSLKLADVYAVITYYLRHTDEVDVYIQQREQQAAIIRREVEARHPEMIGIRERLLARIASKADRQA